MSTSPLLLPREPNPLLDGANGATATSNSHQPNNLLASRATPDYRSISITLWPDPTSTSSNSRYRARHGTLAAITCRMRISTRFRHHMVATLGELFGTASFLFFAFLATNIVNTALAQTLDQPVSANADPARLLFICLAFGMSLAVNAAAFAPISGAMFNPAVTLGLLVIRQIDFVRAVLVIPAQLVGGILAAALVKALTPAPLTVGTGLSTETHVVQGLFIEVFLTAMLVFVIFMVTVEQPGAANAPIVIGLALFMAELGGVFWTGGSLNPARSLGPSVVAKDFPGYHWIYWVGPLLGAFLASTGYWLAKIMNYEAVMDDKKRKEGHTTANGTSRPTTKEGLGGSAIEAEQAV